MPGDAMEDRAFSHRQRALIFNHSSIFDDGGPSASNLYDRRRQKEILAEEAGKQSRKFEPMLATAHPRDVRQTQNSGHRLIMGDGVVERDSKKEHITFVPAQTGTHSQVPKEFWRCSDTFYHAKRRPDDRGGWTEDKLQSARPHRPLSPSHGSHYYTTNVHDPIGSTAGLSLEKDYENVRGYESCRSMNRNMNEIRELQSVHASFLQPVEDNAHEVRQRRGRESLTASERWQQNLHGEHGMRSKAELNLSKKLEPQENPRRLQQEKNYSDIFGDGSQEQNRPSKIQQREEAIGTSSCSWLDTRSEIAVRNMNHYAVDSHNAKERKLKEFLDDRVFEGSPGHTKRDYLQGAPRSSAYTDFKSCVNAGGDGMSQQAALARDQNQMNQNYRQSEQMTHRNRRHTELAGTGVMSSLPDKDYVQRSKARQNKNAEDKEFVPTHGNQKAYYDAEGKLFVAPDNNPSTQGYKSSSRLHLGERPGSSSAVTGHAARKVHELRGQITLDDM